MKLKYLTGVILSVLITGCSSYNSSELIDKDTNIIKNEDIKPINIKNNFNKQSNILKIKDNSVYYLKEINKGAIPLSDEPVTLIFIEEDGLKNVGKGFSGCNDYYFKYKISDNVFVLGEVLTTNFKCEKNASKFENYLFNELGKKPNIKINKDYVVIEGYHSNFLWAKAVIDNSPKGVRKTISSTNKNIEIKDNSFLVNNESSPYIEESYSTIDESYIVDENLDLDSIIILDDIDDKATTSILNNEKENNNVTVLENYRDESFVINEKYLDVYKNINLSNENISMVESYKMDDTEENNLIRLKAINISENLKTKNKIVNFNLKNGNSIPFIEYVIQKDDTLKKIILKTSPSTFNATWVNIIKRLDEISDFNKNIVNVDNIYPEQKIYIPIFKN